MDRSGALRAFSSCTGDSGSPAGRRSPGTERCPSNPGRVVLVKLCPPRERKYSLSSYPDGTRGSGPNPSAINGKSDRVRRDRARHRRRWHRQATSPAGPARAASRNTQTRARHNEASQKPPTTDVRHRRHDAILDTNTQSWRSRERRSCLDACERTCAERSAHAGVCPAHREHEPCERDQQTAEGSGRGQRGVPSRHKIGKAQIRRPTGVARHAKRAATGVEGSLPPRSRPRPQLHGDQCGAVARNDDQVPGPGRGDGLCAWRSRPCGGPGQVLVAESHTAPLTSPPGRSGARPRPRPPAAGGAGSGPVATPCRSAGRGPRRRTRTAHALRCDPAGAARRTGPAGSRGRVSGRTAPCRRTADGRRARGASARTPC